MNWKVSWKVFINGLDLTSAWSNHLISISVKDEAGSTSDSCSLVVDDSHGRLRLPSGGEALVVYLSGVKVFEGVIDVPRSLGSRTAGRTLAIKAKGFDSAGKVKEPLAFNLDDTTLKSFLERAASLSGVSIAVDDELGAQYRDYWASEHESFIALGDRLAKQFGATFKLRGQRAVFVKRGSTTTLPAVSATYGQNLINWDLAPRDPRRAFKGGRARYFDRNAGEVRQTEQEFDTESAGASNVIRPVLGDESEANATLDARKREGDREAGGGSVSLDIAVSAFAEGTCVVSGTRPGIDGTYRIDAVEHRSDRSGGATTSLTLKLPE